MQAYRGFESHSLRHASVVGECLDVKKVDLGTAALSLPVALFIAQMLVTLYLMFFAPDEDIAWAFEHSWRWVLVAALVLYLPAYRVLRRRRAGGFRRQISMQLAFLLAVCVLVGAFFVLNIIAASAM